MSVNRRIQLAGLLFVILFVVLYFFFPRDVEKEPGKIRVGAGLDITGILLETIVEQARLGNQEENLVTSYIFADCCSNTAQWALEAEEIDVGFYCSSAAVAMVNNREEFQIYSPIIMNSEVMAVPQAGSAPSSIGIPRKRVFLGELAGKMYPQAGTLREIDRTYLATSLKLGEVDGAIFDVADAAKLAGEFSFLPLTDKPYISYCMVIRKTVAQDPMFRDFLEYYEQAAELLNQPEEKISRIGMDEAFWDMAGLSFLPAESLHE